MRPRAPRTGETSRRREITPGQAGERSIGGRIGWLAAQAFARALAARPLIGRALLAPYVGGTALTDLSGDRTHPIQFGADGFSGYSSELISTLEGFRRRLWLFRSIILAVRAGLLALVAALTFHFLDLIGVLAPPSWLPILIGLILLGGLGLILVQHVSHLETARVVDRQLGLKAQLGTAVELSLAGESTVLGRSQVRQATTIARRLSATQAISPRVPWRDLRFASFALAGLLAVSFLSSIGFRAPTPEQISRAGLEALDPALNSWYDLDPAMAAELSESERGTTGLQAVVDRLRGQLDRNEISPLEYESQVAQVEDAIRQQAADSSRQEAALTDLARALSETSSTRDISESLNRGDYSDAVSGLNDLAGQADHMSEQARRDLADRLAEAARNTASTNEGLSQAADRAAEALRSGDQAAAEKALKALASQVAGASEQVTPQSELGQALQEAQGETDQSGSWDSELGDAPYPDGAIGAGDGQQPSDSSAGSPTASAGSARSTTGAGAGTASGEKITAADPPNQPLKPDAGGNVLKITGRPSGGGSTVRTDPTTSAPITSNSSGTTTIEGSGSRSSEQVNAAGEVNDVPLDLRSVVRDYFTASDLP